MPFIELPHGLQEGAQGNRIVVAIGVAVIVCLVAGFGVARLVQAGDEAAFVIESSSSSSSQDGQAPDEEATPPASVVVYVSGAVTTPGLVEIPEGSRVGDALTAAGGFDETADSSALNLARVVEDGEQIDVPTREERSAQESAATAGPGSGAPSGSSASSPASSKTNGLVNINTATQAELESLPGVGPSTAQKIIDDRTANGPFKKKEDLKRVSGIGEKKYASLESNITV